ncbi:MAG: BrnT family toxin [Gemmatimonadaceae bacterium]|nr:BrnT family toxin [Gemmatimonadaceae bacterium]
MWSAIPDPDHSSNENRYLLIGMSRRRHLLIVAHAERGDNIRIINARLANRRERKVYEEEFQTVSREEVNV